MNTHEPILDRRAQLEIAREEAAARRARALADQCSPESTPEARIRVWEKLHQVRLPTDPEHAVLVIVAQQTGMDVADVREVQRQRGVAPSS